MFNALEQQLKLEARTCPQCKFEIANPFLERCPRCLSPLPTNAPACSHCMYTAGCPMAAMRESAKQ